MRKLIVPILVLFVFGCSDQKIDTKKAREGLKSQEIIVVSDVNILEKAMEIGAESLTVSSISQDPDGNYIIDLGDSAKYNSSEIFFEYEKANTLEGKSKELFEAYNYNHETNTTSSPNVQFGADKEFVIYTSPVNFEGKEIGILLIHIPRKEIVLTFAD